MNPKLPLLAMFLVFILKYIVNIYKSTFYKVLYFKTLHVLGCQQMLSNFILNIYIFQKSPIVIWVVLCATVL